MNVHGGYEDGNLPEWQRGDGIDSLDYEKVLPTQEHQHIISRLLYVISQFIEARSCDVYTSPFGVFENDYTFYTPDICVVCNRKRLSRRGYEGGPDMIIEVTSPSTKNRDYVTNVKTYRRLGTREYWIVDPKRKCVRTYFYEENISREYTFLDDIPVKIFNGKLVICLDELL